MKKIPLLSILFLASASLVNAIGMKGNDIYDAMGFWGLGMFMGLGLVAIIAGVLLFVFWLLMLIDCLKRDFRKDVEKIA